MHHVDTHCLFIEKFIKDDFNEIKFVRSAENGSDVFTKNVVQGIYERHTAKFLRKQALKILDERKRVGRVLKISLKLIHFSFYLLKLSIRDRI
jgi:hypothetical protein